MPDTGFVSRQAIIDALAEGLERTPLVRAAWLGGSDASGRTDEWSDIDLQIVVPNDAVEKGFGVVHDTLERLSPIRACYRFPTPTWHGHEQEILALERASDCHFVDLVVMREDASDRFLEPERHGAAHVLVDRGGVVRADPFDAAAHAARMAERLPELRVRFALFQNLVTKAVRRGFAADAQATFMSVTIRPLVELLRMRHCPERFDFGLRYLDRDLPSDVTRRVERWVLPASIEDIETFRGEAAALFDRTCRALDAGEWSLPRADGDGR